MDAWTRIAEEKIAAAMEAGEFDDLPGAGRPLELDDDQGVPEDLRLAYKMLKNAGCLPPELLDRREIVTTTQLLAGITDVQEKLKAVQRLNLLITKLNLARRRPVYLEEQQVYLDQIVDRVDQGRRR
jgi:hypothetical protein